MPPGLALDPPDDPPPAHPPEIDPDRLDPDALKVIARLRHMRHRAYLVGGCVRDALLEKTPKDFDIATDAHPGEVRAIFRNCRLIGRRFRLAHVYFRGGKVIEVATFRKNPTDVAEDVADDGDLLITRDNVFGTAEEDAVRRDFTVNGLFYDVAQGEVIDYVGGRADLESRRIATIGDPEIRMREDPVRALRAVRFAARLGFIIAPDTFEAMRRHAGELARCAPARVLEETFKILRCGGSSRAFELLRACGALPVVLAPLAAALDAWDDGRRRGFFAHLAALDRLVRSGEEVPEAVLLGALLMHLGRRGGRPAEPGEAPAAAGPRSSGFEEAEALLASLVQTARLPRKIAERTRLALHAQRLFADAPRKKRRRGRGAAGQQYLSDALQLLRIAVDATGEGREVLERWSRREAERDDRDDRDERADARPSDEGGDGEPVTAAEVEVEDEAEAAPSDAPAGAGANGQPAAAGGRRRRRGGRRRRRRGAGGGAPVTS
jgi:poly(A) polymerase